MELDLTLFNEYIMIDYVLVQKGLKIGQILFAFHLRENELLLVLLKILEKLDFFKEFSVLLFLSFSSLLNNLLKMRSLYSPDKAIL